MPSQSLTTFVASGQPAGGKWKQAIVAINIVWTGVNIGHRIKNARSSLFRSLDRQSHRS
jgi:hypothetical protein